MQKPDYIVNSQNRLQKIVYPDSRTIFYYYDEAGNIVKIADTAFGNIIYQYDLLDRPEKVSMPNAKALSYAYDRVGNRRRVSYPSGEVIFYNYNKNNQLSEIILDAGKIRFEYDKAGRLLHKIFPSGCIINYTYNAAGRLIGLKTTDYNNTILFAFSYDIDAMGNCLGITKTTGNSNSRSQFIYDPLYRLIKIEYPDGNKIKYKYDHIGNRLSMKSSSIPRMPVSFFSKGLGALGILLNKVSYQYNSNNRLLKAGDTVFKYDENGNLLERKVDGKITRYAYTYENRLIKIDYHDGTFSQYTYDALGRRIRKRYPDGKTISYLYDGQNLIQEVNDKGYVIVAYIYDLGIDHPISIFREEKTYFYLHDHNGSVIALTDEGGKIVVQYEYDAWGNIIKEAGNIPNPFRFTGREWDEESGLYYYRARYYDPSIGRFISKNPSPGSLTNPQSLNEYSYAYNNPLSYIDPFGVSAIRPLSRLQAAQMGVFSKVSDVKVFFALKE